LIYGHPKNSAASDRAPGQRLLSFEKFLYRFIKLF
jgi:hypothetical protein